MTLQERPKAVMTRSGPATLLGPELKAGQPAPDFTCRAVDFKPVKLSDYKGKTTVFASVPSLDTPVCDEETRRFNKEASALGDVQVVVVSADLPFAQKRYCGAAGIDKVATVSDYYDNSFGKAFGTLIKETHFLSRAVFIVDPNGKLAYVEYVPELGKQPNFEAILGKLKQAVKA